MIDLQAMASAQPFDGECRLYLELPNGMRHPIWIFPGRTEGLNSFKSTVVSFAKVNMITCKLVDAATALLYDPESSEAHAVMYLEVAPDRRKHSGDIRIDRRQNPRQPIDPQPPEGAA